MANSQVQNRDFRTTKFCSADRHATAATRKATTALPAAPARTATCDGCNKKGHYSSACHSSTVRDLKVAEESCHFLGSVHHVRDIDTTWFAVLNVVGNRVKCKVDPGAADPVVGERFSDGRPLQPCEKILKSTSYGRLPS
ncbi:hypothetical protein ElyMa_003275800 [Elysia marginata]|uniref:CCHC-type domain-containing protein n=1 Tax=Elysia marginata TaxID=1093978 RepID=A0AAV4J9F0_9GAST|nr:hypothetical protein ElyMa_003275800 [Elysia marginata]